MSRILAVDCDLTVCPSDVGWREWLAERHGYVKCPMTEYNFGSYYPHVEDPFEYWRTLEYSQFQPIEGAVEKLEALSKYFDIVFISAIKGQHTKSKYYWLEEHFPFSKGYLATKEKFLMNDSVVAMIDDRLDNLKGFDAHKRILYKTPYVQTTECSVGYTIEDWNSFSVKEFCKEYLN
jgi:5'(3')-deoxyribonucleotidase